MDKIKVVWICSFSTTEIRKLLSISAVSFLEKYLYTFLGRSDYKDKDSAIWNVNALREFEDFDDISLHVICPVRKLTKEYQEFELRGINYHFFKDENSSLYRKIIRQCFTKYNSTFTTNRKRINHLIKNIRPDIVHLMGAENPLYSLGALDIMDDIPVIVHLQTLLTRLLSITNNPVELRSFRYKAKYEQQILKKCNYIFTGNDVFTKYIRKNIKHDAIIFNCPLAMGQSIYKNETEKKIFDFVYFSASIDKAGDLVVDAFCEAFKENPNITLDVIGGYDSVFKKTLQAKLISVGAHNNVTFEGLLPTHDDVIRQIRKSRFAILPYRIDLVPNTIHEAMANGLPVITTITEGTPFLNSKRESVLLAPIDDASTITQHILTLVENPNFAKKLRENAYLTEYEYGDNLQRTKKWVEAYYACIKNFRQGTPISYNLLMPSL